MIANLTPLSFRTSTVATYNTQKSNAVGSHRAHRIRWGGVHSSRKGLSRGMDNATNQVLVCPPCAQMVIHLGDAPYQKNPWGSFWPVQPLRPVAGIPPGQQSFFSVQLSSQLLQLTCVWLEEAYPWHGYISCLDQMATSPPLFPSVLSLRIKAYPFWCSKSSAFVQHVGSF